MTAPMSGGRPATNSPATTLTLSEIADLTGRDLKTIKNWNDSGKGRWPNAAQDQARAAVHHADPVPPTRGGEER